ncbi:MAG TPA: type II secretion system F family protein [Acidimicrobiia bacterium]|jgi:type IV pilus assembly protein PilC|nr:type II secretion system F family protein [Acidimicrobiia bacterium]
MTKFKYAAVTSDGQSVSGMLEADHANDVRARLAEKGMFAQAIKERQGLMKLELTPKRVPRQEIMNFSRQLAAFVRAGIPIIDAIETLRSDMKNDRLRKVLAEVAESLRSGETLSNAIGEHSDVFPGFYVTILRSAELTGHVDTVLDQLASYIEREENARRKIKSALTYPAVIMVMAILSVVIIVTVALPKFRGFFQDLDAKLPLPTRMLLAFTDFLQHWGWAVGLGMVLLVIATTLYVKTPRGRRVKDSFLLRAPVFGDLVRFTLIERFCRILASLVKAGVQIPDAMAIASGSTSNVIYTTKLNEAREAMIRGEGMSGPITATGLFPGGVCQMVRVGEDTGTLDTQLETAADFYGKEVGYKLDRMIALFEPLVIVIVGVIVGFVAIALVSALYGIFNQVKLS